MVNINVILDLANDYSINADVFHDSGNFIKEYSNLCSATALFLLSLQSEDLIEKTRKDLIAKCEVNIKKQENIEKLHFSSLEPQNKKKRKISHANQTLISHSEASENIDKKPQIIPTEEYYSESDDSVTIPVSPIKLTRKSQKKKCVTNEDISMEIKEEIENVTEPINIVSVPFTIVETEQVPDLVSFNESSIVTQVTAPNDEGFYNFSLEHLKALSQRFQGKTNPGFKMATVYADGMKKSLERFEKCKDFLCPPENQIREWFPTSVQARIRAIALDPYGLMKLQTTQSLNAKEGRYCKAYVCQDKNCHARITVRNVDPDSEGNSWGIYGCLLHQHPLPRKNRSEIIFENKTLAEEFFKQHLQPMYSLGGVHRNKSKGYQYTSYTCRRPKLSTGYAPCQSRFGITPAFAKDETFKELPDDQKSYVICGVFYHSHENDEKWNRDEYGGWKTNGIRKNANTTRKKPKIEYPRIKNGKIIPLWARATMSVEEVLKAQKERKEANRKAGSLGFYAGTSKTNKSQPKKETKSKKIKES